MSIERSLDRHAQHVTEFRDPGRDLAEYVQGVRKTIDQAVRTDWGILPRSAYLSALERSNRNIAEKEKELVGHRTKLDQVISERNNFVVTSKDDPREVGSINKQLLEIYDEQIQDLRNLIILQSSTLNYFQAHRRYRACALDLNLSPTLTQ